MSTPPDDHDLETSSVFEGGIGREFLFFGDVESCWRAHHETHVDKEAGHTAGKLNKAIWEQAAKSFHEGRLAGVFASD